jgi:cytochrome c oxidase subunit 4|tara:strand:- start:139 stop:441 length:303 start_codon:yes stop_codon:yes gene_type:complete
MSGTSADEIRKHVKVYVMVFVALMVLTIATVGVSYLELAIPLAILVALVVATVKGSLVASYFMHLVGEKKPVYWALMLTAVFFCVLMFLPLFTMLDHIGQ